MSLFLLLNTCGEEAVVALGSSSGELLREERMPGRSASEQMLGAVRRVLDGVAVAELAAVAVVAGPGSFTGVRVGLAAAKGLCEAGGVAVLALSRLDLVTGLGEVAFLDAGRGEFFVTGGRLVRELPPGDRVTSEPRLAERTGARLVAEPGGQEMLRAALRRAAAEQWDDAASLDADYLRRTDAELAAERAGTP